MFSVQWRYKASLYGSSSDSTPNMNDNFHSRVTSSFLQYSKSLLKSHFKISGPQNFKQGETSYKGKRRKILEEKTT
jgi:hypothetical protein